MADLHKIKLYIVVADADIATHKLIKKTAKACKKNTIVTSVYTGTQLMDLLLQRGFYKLESPLWPDVVLLDISSPEMNGPELLKEIRSNEKLKSLTVVVLTNEQGQTATTREALDLGVDGLLIKPLDPNEVRPLILDYCERAGSENHR